MILKFKTGRGARGLINYIAAGAGQAQPMFTNMAGKTPRELAREIAALRSLRPNLGRAAAHLILNHSPDQRELTEDEWRTALDLALTEHGAENVPYAAYMHNDKAHQHLHVFFLRICPHGNVISDSNSYARNTRAARAIEHALDLDVPTPRTAEDRYPRVSGVRAERGRRRFERLHSSLNLDQPPQKGTPKMIYPSLIFSTIDEAKDLDDLKRRLAEKGIEAFFVQAGGTAEPTGWLLRQSGPAGTWLKGSDINRSLSLKKVRERIEQRRQERQKALNREILGDLLDDVQQSAQADEEGPQQRLVRQQRSLLGAIIQIPIEVLRRLVAALMNRIAAFLERLFGLREGALGRIEVDEGGQPQAAAPAVPQADATAQQIAKLAAAQKIMAAALEKTVTAIREGDASLLPAARVKDAQMQEARQAVVDKVREIEGDDDDDYPQHERERT